MRLVPLPNSTRPDFCDQSPSAGASGVRGGSGTPRICSVLRHTRSGLLPGLALVSCLSVFLGSVNEVDGQVRSEVRPEERTADATEPKAGDPATPRGTHEVPGHAQPDAQRNFEASLRDGSFEQRYEHAMRLGQRLMDAEQFDEARWAFRSAVQDAERNEPESDREAIALLALGRLQTRTDHAGEAHTTLSRALWILEEGHPQDPSPLVVEAFRSLNELHARRRSWSDAQTVAQQWHFWVSDVLDEQHPANLEPMDRAADALMAMDRTQEAEAVLDAAVDLGRSVAQTPRLDHGVRLSRLARMQQEREGFESALPIYHEAYGVLSASLGPDNPLAVSNLTGAGACLRDMGEFEAAVQTLDFAATLVAPHQSSAIRPTSSSLVRRSTNDSTPLNAIALTPAASHDAFATSAPIDRGLVSPDGMARAAFPLRHAVALRTPEQVEQTRVVVHDATQSVARYEAEYAAYYESERRQRERAALQGAAPNDRSEPSDWSAASRAEPLIELAITHVRRGDSASASEAALRAARTAPGLSRAWYTAGIAAMDSGSWPAAAARFDQAIRRDPSDPNLRLWRCLALGLSGDRTKGISELRTYVALHRDTEMIDEPAWSDALTRFVLGDINAAELLAILPNADGIGEFADEAKIRGRYCQAYYIIGCRQLWLGPNSGAQMHVARLALDWAVRTGRQDQDEQFMAESLLKWMDEQSTATR